MAPDLLDSIYCAPLEPDRWSDAIRQVAALVGCQGGQFLIWDDSGNHPAFSRRAGPSVAAPARSDRRMDPRRQRAMTQPIGEWTLWRPFCDERFDAVGVADGGTGGNTDAGMDAGTDTVTDAVTDAGTDAGTERPAGWRFVAGVRLAAEDGMQAMLAVTGLDSAATRPFEPGAFEALRDVTSHLSRAARLQIRFSRLHERLGVHSAALDGLSLAVAVVDRDAIVRYTNARAAEVLRLPGGPFERRAGRLISRAPRDVGRFAAAVAAAADRRVGDAIRLDADGGNGLHCVIMPMSPRLALAYPFERPMALLLLVDPAAGVPVDGGVLQSLFGLTRAEARVAAALASGLSLGAFAAASCISIMTARAQLRAVFSKVGVNRQSELVAILQRLTQVSSLNGTGSPVATGCHIAAG